MATSGLNAQQLTRNAGIALATMTRRRVLIATTRNKRTTELAQFGSQSGQLHDTYTTPGAIWSRTSCRTTGLALNPFGI